MPKVNVRLLPENKSIEVEVGEGETIGDLLAKLGVSRESHIVLVDGSPVPETERIPQEGEIVVVRVVSGG